MTHDDLLTWSVFTIAVIEVLRFLFFFVRSGTYPWRGERTP
jgi:hypothetical protein